MDLETAKETSKVFLQVAAKTREALKTAEAKRAKAKPQAKDEWLNNSAATIIKFLGNQAKDYNSRSPEARLQVLDLVKVLDLAATHLKKASEK